MVEHIHHIFTDLAVSGSAMPFSSSFSFQLMICDTFCPSFTGTPNVNVIEAILTLQVAQHGKSVF